MDHIIIVAGGQGLRMGLPLPKQFAVVGGRPVLMHTITRFHEAIPELDIIVVLPHDQHDYWLQLCGEYAFEVSHTVVDGGQTRFHSSLNGLLSITDDADGVVGIHDGVRPFASAGMIRRCFDAAREHRTAVPVIPLNDSLRLLNDDGSSHNVNRSDCRIVQTPQVFSIRLLREAYQQPWQESFTDDASVVESLGVPMTLVEGERENIKLTNPIDMIIAEELVKQQQNENPEE